MRNASTGGKHWRVAGAEHKRLLNEFISARMGVSGRAAKRLLDDRLVFVNGRRVWMARHPLKTGDVVEVIGPGPAGKRPLAAPAILFENDHYLVVNKAPGILSTGSSRSVEAQLKQLGLRIHAVHRLDRDTSGCLVFAKSGKARDAIVSVFEERAIRKEYEGLACGAFPRSVRVIRNPIDNLEAETGIRVIRFNRRASYLHFDLVTGRTHQIRRHLEAVGSGLVGDKQYGSSQVDDPVLRRAPRQMLHACRIQFRDPFNGSMIHVRAPMPRDMEGMLISLGLADPGKRGRPRRISSGGDK